MSKVDLDAVRAWITALHGRPDAPVVWQTFVDDKSTAGDVGARTDFGPLDQFAHDLTNLNDKHGHGIYAVVNRCDPSVPAPRSHTKRHVISPIAWFVDSDTGSLCKPLHKRVTIEVESNSGPHDFWRCVPGTTWTQWLDGQKVLAVYYRTDPAMINKDRVMRVPGFRHLKNPTKPFDVKIKEVNHDAEYTLADILPRAVPTIEEWNSYRTWHQAHKAALELGGADLLPDFEAPEWEPLLWKAQAWNRALTAANDHALRSASDATQAKLPAMPWNPATSIEEWESLRDWYLALAECIGRGVVDGAKLPLPGTDAWAAKHPEIRAWLSACRRHRRAKSQARIAKQPDPVADLRFGVALPADAVELEAKALTADGAKRPELYARAFGEPDGTYDPHDLIVVGSFSGARREATVAELLAKVKVRDTVRIFCPFHPNSKTPAAYIRKTSRGSTIRCHSCDAYYREAVPEPVATDAAPKTEGEQVAEAATRAYAMTDMGNAERLVDRHGIDLRWSPALGWMVWDGARWARDEGGSVPVQRAMETVRGIVSEAQAMPFGDEDGKRAALIKWSLQSESAGKIQAMVGLAKHMSSVSVTATAFDGDPWILNCPNGVIDLQTGDLRPHDRKNLCGKVAGVAYDPNATAPRWEQFLAEVIPDAEVRSWVQRHLGYCLTGVIREHLLPVWWGSGRNGKGTLIETVSAVMGDYAVSIDPSLLLEKANDAHPTERMALLGARLAFASEPSRKKGWSMEVVKRLTGGDTIVGRYMRSDEVRFRPTHKLVMLANHKPSVPATEQDTATWERMRLVPFTEEFSAANGKQDPTLPDKLLAERQGILAWLVRGCIAWQRDGLKCPDAIREATDAYRTESDQVRTWVDDACIVASGKTKPEELKVSAGRLRKSYEEWCEAEGIRYPLGAGAWAEQLKRLGGVHPSDKSVPGGKSNGEKFWRGIRLRFSDEDSKTNVLRLVPFSGDSNDPEMGSQPVISKNEPGLAKTMTTEAEVSWDSLWPKGQ